MRFRLLHSISAGVALALVVGLLLIPSLPGGARVEKLREFYPEAPKPPLGQPPAANIPLLLLSIIIIAAILSSFLLVRRIVERIEEGIVGA